MSLQANIYAKNFICHLCHTSVNKDYFGAKLCKCDTFFYSPDQNNEDNICEIGIAHKYSLHYQNNNTTTISYNAGSKSNKHWKILIILNYEYFPDAEEMFDKYNKYMVFI